MKKKNELNRRGAEAQSEEKEFSAPANRAITDSRQVSTRGDDLERRRKEIVRKQKRQGRFFVALLFVALCLCGLNLSATSTLNGTIENAYGNPVATNVIIAPLFTPNLFGSGTLISPSTNFNTDTNGNFSVQLLPGPYKITIGVNVRDSLLLIITNDLATYRLENVVTNLLPVATFTSPINEVKSNKGQPSGYAPLDTNSYVPTANLPPGLGLPAGLPANFIVYNASSNGVAVPMSGAGTISTGGVLTLANSGTAGTYFQSTFGLDGRETGGANPSTLTGFGITDGNVTAASMTNSTNAFTGAFTGSGAAVTTINAGNISSGTLNAARLPASGVTAGIATKVTVDSTGRVTATNALASADIPSLDASKITTGTFATNLLTSPLPVGIGGTGANTARAVGAQVGVNELSATGGNNSYIDMSNATPAFEGQLGLSYYGNKQISVWGAGSTTKSDWLHSFTFPAGISEIGSDSNMDSLVHQVIIDVSGCSNNYNLAADPQICSRSYSASVGDSGSGFTCAVMGAADGTGKATTISTVAGPSFDHVPRTRASTLIPAHGTLVSNPDAVNNRGFIVCSVGLGGFDSGNYGWLDFDSEHQFLHGELLNATTAGIYQPDDVVYQFLGITGATTAPQQFSVYTVGTNQYTVYSNNISGGAGSIWATCAYGAPASSGTLTKIAGTGTGDSTFAYTSTSTVRTWHDDFKLDPVNGVLMANSNIISANGAFVSQKTVQSNSATNWNPFGSTNEAIIIGGNADGLAVGSTRGQEVLYLGQGGHPIMAMTFNNWFTGTSTDVGGDELPDDNNDGMAVLSVHGSFANNVTNVAANYTANFLDHTIVVTATGKVITLPDATSHIKGREYVIKLTASGTCTVTNATGAQNIDAALSFSLSAQNKYVKVQSDGTQWWIVANN